MAVNGIYNKVASTALYGKNLSYELVDVISKRYSPLQANTYLTALSSFDYADNSVQTGLSNTCRPSARDSTTIERAASPMIQ